MVQAERVTLRVYWITWAALLAMTIAMLVLDRARVSRGVLVGLMLAAMTVKATLIAGTFMHLRHERPGLIMTVVIGLFVFGLVLFVLIAPDAARIHEMVNRR